MSTLGERIKEIRKDKSMTQDEFAKKISVSRPFISRIEANKEHPSESLLKLIAMTFSVNYDWLADGKGIKNNQIANTLLLLKDSKKLSLEPGEELTYAICVSLLLSILGNAPVKRNSDEYYQDRISSIIRGLDTLFTKISIDEMDEFELNSIFKHISNRIQNCMLEALNSCVYQDMNEELYKEMQLENDGKETE